MKEMQSFKPPEKETEMIAALEEFQKRYNEAGFVPAADKDRIREEFKQAVNDIIDRTDLPELEKSLIRYRIRIIAIMQSPRANNKIRYERDKMVSKLQQLKNDIGVWENNIGFFKQTEAAEDTLNEFTSKIEDAHQRIESLEKKIRIIDELDDEI